MADYQEAARNELMKRLPQGSDDDDDLMTDEPLVKGTEREDQLQATLDKYCSDAKSALQALQDGNSKKAASILQGLIKQHEDGKTGAVDIEQDQKKQPAESY